MNRRSRRVSAGIIIAAVAAVVAGGCTTTPAAPDPTPDLTASAPAPASAPASAPPSAPAPGSAGDPPAAIDTSAQAHPGVQEFPIEYPADRTTDHHPAGSTHELVADPSGTAFWITGQNEATVVRATLDGATRSFEMPAGSGPHGITFDAAGQLWVSLEFAGQLVRLDPEGRIVETVDVSVPCASCVAPLNPHPHGLAVGTDGVTLWFTGKSTGTIGRVSADRTVTTWQIPTVGSMPIYIEPATDGSMWFTELVGNAIGRITPDGQLSEFKIPTANSRPISLVRAPDGRSMWFSEEAGNKVGRIALDGTITEFPVPMAQRNVILAALQFDRDGDLWVQQYVDQQRPDPAGDDHLVEIDRSLLSAGPGVIDGVTFRYFGTPSVDTVMHRIVLGPDGALWFTELATNKLGRIAPN